MTVPGSMRPGGISHSSLRPKRVLLRLAVLRQAQPAHDFLRQVAAYAVTEDRDLRQDLDSGLELALLRSVLRDATVASPDASHAATVEQDIASGKPAEHVHARGLDLRRQPLHEGIQRDDVVAVILQRRRDDREAGTSNSA